MTAAATTTQEASLASSYQLLATSSPAKWARKEKVDLRTCVHKKVM